MVTAVVLLAIMNSVVIEQFNHYLLFHLLELEKHVMIVIHLDEMDVALDAR